MSGNVDLLGRPLTETEMRIKALYTEVKALLQQPGLPPTAEANLRQTLAHLWNIVNDLGLEFEQLYDLGV